MSTSTLIYQGKHESTYLIRVDGTPYNYDKRADGEITNVYAVDESSTGNLKPGSAEHLKVIRAIAGGAQ